MNDYDVSLSESPKTCYCEKFRVCVEKNKERNYFKENFASLRK